jgi:hypothetical protein
MMPTTWIWLISISVLMQWLAVMLMSHRMAQLDRQIANLDVTLTLREDRMTTQFANLQQAVDTLTATITAEDTVIDGATTLIQSIPNLIQSAVNDALQKGAPPSTLSAFATLNDVIVQKGAALAAAVATVPTVQPTAPTSDAGGSSAGTTSTGTTQTGVGQAPTDSSGTPQPATATG